MPRLSAEEARHRLFTARVARLATVTADGRPHVVPVTFAATGPDTLVTAVDHKPKRTAALARLANIAANPTVTLLADRYAEDWTSLWWARADGSARIIDPHADAFAHADAIVPLVERYAQYHGQPPAGAAILISVERWSGWEASAPP